MSDIGNKNIFAANLAYYMDKKQVDRYQLCEALDFKYSTLCEWLSAKKYPRIDKIEKLANYFEIPKSALIEKSSEPPARDPLDEKILQLFSQLTPEERREVLGLIFEKLHSRGAI